MKLRNGWKWCPNGHARIHPLRIKSLPGKYHYYCSVCKRLFPYEDIRKFNIEGIPTKGIVYKGPFDYKSDAEQLMNDKEFIIFDMKTVGYMIKRRVKT